MTDVPEQRLEGAHHIRVLRRSEETDDLLPSVEHGEVLCGPHKPLADPGQRHYVLVQSDWKG